MQLFSYKSLTLTKEVEELIEEECIKSVTILCEPLFLEKEIVGLNSLDNISVYSCTMPSPLSLVRQDGS